ncbi:MAG: hypothetical protein ACI977_000110 [Candidatus Nanohaloarchaea archaeon]|jgi:hypothetical protein
MSSEELYSIPDSVDNFFDYWDGVEDRDLEIYESLTTTRVVSCRNPDRVKDVDDLINEARSDWSHEDNEYAHEFELSGNAKTVFDYIS